MVIEDAPKIRDMLAALFEGSPGFVSAGAYRTGEAALKALPAERPDVLLVDLQLPGMSGMALLRTCRLEHHEVERVVLTGHDEPEWVFPALRAGANGYLLKGLAPDQLLDAVQLVREGGSWMSPGVARLVLREFRRQAGEGGGSAELKSLSKREREVVELLARGFQTKEIASRMFLSDRTISSHLHHIYGKLQVRSATGAVVKFHRATAPAARPPEL